MMGDSVADSQSIRWRKVLCGVSWAAHRLTIRGVQVSGGDYSRHVINRLRSVRAGADADACANLYAHAYPGCRAGGIEPADAETVVAAVPPSRLHRLHGYTTTSADSHTGAAYQHADCYAYRHPEPTATPTIEPTPTASPDYGFILETAQKFPTESLAPNVVRIYAYIYSPTEFGLEGYSLSVRHNGAELAVDQQSTGGLPRVTRDAPGPYSRFTNLTAIFVETQAGDWVVQLADADGNPAGPPATFQLSSDEETRELYVRYRLEGG